MNDFLQQNKKEVILKESKENSRNQQKSLDDHNYKSTLFQEEYDEVSVFDL